jgi:hypothetical protein
MPLPPYEVDRDESKASLALTTAIGAIILGVLTFWFVLQAFDMAIILFGPMIGLAMLVAAGFCFYWLSKSDTKTEKKSVRTAAFILTVLLVIPGMAAVAFLAMGGGGIYK